MTTARFFVYGSLCEGMVHFDKIKNFIESSTLAKVQAQVYRLNVGFPVMLQEGLDWIPGQLLEMKNSDFLMGLLDEFFGCNWQEPAKSLHSRKEIEVVVEEGHQPVKAWAYFLNPTKLPKTATLITDGDWQRAMKESPPLLTQLTEKQAAYILKLGQTKGRDIVPIDLGLYRELMNLEVIVDKGRRLALSKLGQEVCRYLA